MTQYDYKVVPAPAKGSKAKGIKSPEGRFAHSIETVLNQMAADGWEYQRAELLPSEERSGLTGSTTNWRNILIFRKAVATAAEPEAMPAVTAAAVTAAEPMRREPPLHERVEDAEPEETSDNVVELQDVQTNDDAPRPLTGIERERQTAEEADETRSPPNL